MPAPNVKDLVTMLVAMAPFPATSGTTLVVETNRGSRLPAVPFVATISPDKQLPTIDNSEQVTVTSVDTDTLTIVRAYGVTTAKSIQANWRLYHGPTSAHITGAYDRSNHTGTQPESSVTNLETDLAAKYSSGNPPPYPVTSVAGKTGIVTLGESDIANLVSDLAAKAADSSVVHTTGNETMNGTLNMSSHRITNLADPASVQDAATKNYVDAHVVRTARFVVAPFGDTRPADYTCASSTGNEVEINNAIAAAGALANDGVVDLLDGTFTLGASIVPLNGVWLRGQGMFNTKITTVSGSTFGIIDNYSSHNPASPWSNALISDLELDGSNMLRSNGKKAINANALVNCKFTRLYVHDTTATGIGADDFTGVTVTECIVQNCGYTNPHTITAMSYATSTFTVTTGTPHGHLVGDTVVVTGMIPLGYNGVFKVTTVIDTNNFTIGTSNNSNNLQLGVNPGTATTFGQISDSILGNNGIGIASGSMPAEYMVITNNICIGNQNNNFLIEADNVGVGSDASYIFSDNISISGGQAGYRCTGTPNTQINNNFDYGSLIGCFVGVTNISKTLTAASWAASVATFTTSAVHNLSVGMYVTVSGVTPSGYNGYYYVTSVPTTTTFTVAVAVDPGGVGTVFGSSQTVGHAVDGTQINHNIFANPILYGTQIFAHSDGVSARDNIIKNGTFYGMYIGSGYGTIAGNHVYGNGYDGIEIITGGNYQPLDGLDVSDNIVYNNGQIDSIHDGINVNPNANTPITNLTLNNNHCFDNQNTKTQRYGIILRSGSDLTNCSVVGGALAGNSTAPILIQNTSSSISVLGVSGTSNVNFSLGTLGNLAITTPNTGNVISLAVTQSDTTNNPTAAIITNSGTGHGLDIVQNGVLATNKFALYVNSNAINTNSPLAWIRSTNASTTKDTLQLDNAGTGNALNINSGNTKFSDAVNLALGTTTGTKFGTATNQKLAFYNATPIVQPSGDIITALTSLGLIATPTLSEADITNLASDLALLAALASPAFTGTPTAPTAAPGTNTTQLATTAFVQAASASPTASGTDASLRSTPVMASEFLVGSTAGVTPFQATAVSSGTANTPSITSSNHPGILRARCSTTSGSGLQIGSNTAQIVLGGGEKCTFIVHFPAFTSSTYFLGFHNSVSATDPTQGCYLKIASTGVASGNTVAGGSITATGTTTTLSAATWYSCEVIMNSNATSVTFNIYNDSGTLIWTDTLSSGIPTSATGVAIVGTSTAGAAGDIYNIDYMSMLITRVLTRK